VFSAFSIFDGNVATIFVSPPFAYIHLERRKHCVNRCLAIFFNL